MGARVKMVCVASVVFAACTVTLPELSPDAIQRASAKWPDIGKDQLFAGRTMYITKCSGCHSLPQPSLYSADEWGVKLDEMAARAKLSSDETERIYQYLFSVARR